MGLDGRAALLRRLGDGRGGHARGLRRAGAARPPLRLPRRACAGGRDHRRIPAGHAAARAGPRVAAAAGAGRRGARRLLAASGGARRGSCRSHRRLRAVPQALAVARVFAAGAAGGGRARGDRPRRADRPRPSTATAAFCSTSACSCRAIADFLQRTHAVGDEARRRVARADGDRCSTASPRRCAKRSASRRRRSRSPACSKAAPGPPAGASPRSAAQAARRRCPIDQRRHRLLISRHRNNRGDPMPDMLTVVDHPLILHKLTLMRRQGHVDQDLPRAAWARSRIARLRGDARPAARAGGDRDAAREDEGAADQRQEAVSRARSCARATGCSTGMLELLPAARVGHVGLYRDPATLVRRRVLLQGARGHRRPARHRRRPDARHRPLGGRGAEPPQGGRRRDDQVRLPARGPRGHRGVQGRRIPTCRSLPPRSTTTSTSTATSFRAWAMPATASSAPNRVQRQVAAAVRTAHRRGGILRREHGISIKWRIRAAFRRSDAPSP